ncbi:MAG: thioredoxin-dependent thiol peroxidase [Gemmatimonadetes bacterium]|nr:thioredoxin-dependent thiol peroxidase [Gemmatimonadota bacterium]|tara:strand:- start:86 stop:541 length:456 start_codon:yes stop_codon:yes gene_type:complete
MLSVGDPAPNFTLADADGNLVKLSDFKGKKVVLYFYPKDDTPGCTKEACGFRDAQNEYWEANAVVIGVSPDSEKSHQRFRDKYDLPFLLLADPDRQAIDAFKVWKEKNMYGKKYMGVERSTFIIDEAGMVQEILRKVKVEGHVQTVLSSLA